jgi:hypothetical protein
MDMDLRYLQETSQIPPYQTQLPEPSPNVLKYLLIGMTTLNEQITEFIIHNMENFYNYRVKRIIEYLLHQRDYYLAIAMAKSHEGKEIPVPVHPLTFIEEKMMDLGEDEIIFKINIDMTLGSLGPLHFQPGVNAISKAVFILQKENHVRNVYAITSIANKVLQTLNPVPYQLNHEKN